MATRTEYRGSIIKRQREHGGQGGQSIVAALISLVMNDACSGTWGP